MNNSKKIFELHNTINLDIKNVDIFEKFCSENNLKAIHVLILYNDNYNSKKNFEENKIAVCNDLININKYSPSLLYQTSKYVTCELDDAKKKLKEITILLENNGFTVIREKIEGVLLEPNIVLAKNIENAYYENHFVIDIKNYNEDIILKLDELNKMINKYDNLYVPLSINLKKTLDNQIFITARNYINDTENINDLVEKNKNLITENYEIIKIIKEVVLFDSNLYIDVQKY